MKRFFGLVGAVLLTASVAQADTLLRTYDGNDCAGEFGGSFPTCQTPVEYGGSPVIAKYNVDEDLWEFNSAMFPSITGGEFSFTGIPGLLGTWTYDPGDGDPFITHFVTKYGPQFNLFLNDGEALSGDWYTNGTNELSHITFYDTGDNLVAEPGLLALMGLGLVGVARRLRR